MNPINQPNEPPTGELEQPVSDVSIAELVGQVYEVAPAVERGRLLEHLLRPLGVLSLVAVANGIFAKIRFRSDWPDTHIHADDALNVQTDDIVILVNYVQQVSVNAVDGLADMVAASPVMAGSAAAALLITVLLKRARNRRADDSALDDSFAAPA